jgi:hypothetical protein
MVVRGKIVLVFMFCSAVSLYPMHKSKGNNSSPRNGSPISGSPKSDSPLNGSPLTVIRKITQKKVKPEILSAEAQALIDELSTPVNTATREQYLVAVNQFNELMRQVKSTKQK